MRIKDIALIGMLACVLVIYLLLSKKDGYPTMQRFEIRANSIEESHTANQNSFVQRSITGLSIAPYFYNSEGEITGSIHEYMLERLKPLFSDDPFIFEVVPYERQQLTIEEGSGFGYILSLPLGKPVPDNSIVLESLKFELYHCHEQGSDPFANPGDKKKILIAVIQGFEMSESFLNSLIQIGYDIEMTVFVGVDALEQMVYSLEMGTSDAMFLCPDSIDWVTENNISSNELKKASFNLYDTYRLIFVMNTKFGQLETSMVGSQ